MKKFEITESPEILRSDVMPPFFASEIRLDGRKNYCQIFSENKEKADKFTTLISHSVELHEELVEMLDVLDLIKHMEVKEFLSDETKAKIKKAKQLIHKIGAL